MQADPTPTHRDTNIKAHKHARAHSIWQGVSGGDGAIKWQDRD